MKNSFKHFIKHFECKLYINPKNDNYNINMQTSKTIKQYKSFACNIVSYLAKKNQNLNKP